MSALLNFTVDDTSPIFRYEPYSDGVGSNNGWQTWYSDSGFNSQPGEEGSGESFHLTSFNGANVSLNFFGSGITLFGRSNCSYNILVNGVLTPWNSTSAPVDEDILFAASMLPLGDHSITLTVKSAGNDSSDQLWFDKAVVSADTGIMALNTTVIDNQDRSTLSYSGSWSTYSDPQVPSASNPSPFHFTTTEGSATSMQFRGRAVAVHGKSSVGNGRYSVSLDGNVDTYNGSTFWMVPDALLYFQDGLDESEMHSLNITNLDESEFSLNSITIYASRITESPSASYGRSNIGIISGAVITVVTILIILGLYLWSKLRFRGSKQRLSEISLSTRPPSRFSKSAKAFQTRDDPESLDNSLDLTVVGPPTNELHTPEVSLDKALPTKWRNDLSPVCDAFSFGRTQSRHLSLPAHLTPVHIFHGARKRSNTCSSIG
ncbi:hypothetical protein BD410DRAFT_348751 [Rickenella mellea]|uniref:Transmembrane protein n=1 Tax=Rickenella mellea TaxID=50990 RepID=A0A4Y7QKI8_9AGAM|nr:hypothetical protein BD410DRAFT_348751 [Rickenella mellea]